MNNKNENNKKVENWFETIFAPAFKPLLKEEMELAAIWLNKAITLPNGSKSARIAPGNKVNIIDGELVSSIPFQPASHRVIGCYGTINSSSLSMLVTCLKTNEPLIVKMK